LIASSPKESKLKIARSRSLLMLMSCEQISRRLGRTSRDGRQPSAAEEWQGKRQQMASRAGEPASSRRSRRVPGCRGTSGIKRTLSRPRRGHSSAARQPSCTDSDGSRGAVAWTSTGLAGSASLT
jgi:hypothetical protein